MLNPPYKGSNGSWLTQSIFWDKWSQLAPGNKHAQPVFTFDSDRPGLINAKDTFLALGDLTGYEWAIKYLGSYDHWLYLMQRGWFSEQVEVWRNELHTRFKATALKRIQEISGSTANEAQSLAASKYLAERGWEKSSRGRPSKSELAGEMKKQAKIVDDLDEDVARLGLTLIQGGKPNG